MQRKLFKIGVTVMLIIMMMTLAACSQGGEDIATSSQTQEQPGDSKVKIETTFYAIGEFAKAVGKEKVEVNVIIPDGTEPHDFEPKAMDIARISDADIFAYNGIGMESWVDKALESAGAGADSTKLVKVDTSLGAQLIKNNDSIAVGEHGVYDPHLWLSLKGAQKQAENIKDALVKIDSHNKEYYEKNYKEFYEKLQALYKSYVSKFAALKNKNFVTGHAAFAYFCKDFGLKQNSVENVFAEGEPSAKRLKELIDYCQQNKISTIFMENMASPKISETLAREVNAKVVKILTLEAKEDNLDFIGCMEYNLKNVYESLK